VYRAAKARLKKGAGVRQYKYNGKELNQDFGLDWMDYGARWYDAAIGRWNAVDPLAEKYYSFSTFGYTANNPTNFIDPDGAQVEAAVSYRGEGEDRQAVVTITVTGSILDLSDNWISGASAMARRLKGRAKDISGRSVDVTGLGITDSEGNEVSGNVTLNFDFQFEAVNNISEISDDDHLIVLANFDRNSLGEKQSGSLGITNMDGGRVTHIDAGWTSGLNAAISGRGTTIATHEILGHFLGAWSAHPDDKNNYVYELSQRKGRGFDSRNGRKILSNVYSESGKINQGPIFSPLSNANNPRNPYRSPYTGWRHPNGRSGSIFNRDVGVNQQKYYRAVIAKQ